VIDDLDNGGETASIRAFLDKDNTADLDQAPFACGNRSFTHFDDLRGNG